MGTNDIEAVSMAVQISGKVYYVALPQDRMLLLASMAASLSDSGSLPVKLAPEGTVLEALPR